MSEPSAPSAGKLTVALPHPVLTQIHGTPDPASLQRLNNEIRANAASIFSRLGGGSLGYLGIVVKRSVYNRIASQAFVPPTAPAATCPRPPGNNPSGTAITAARRVWDGERAAWEEYQTVQGLLRAQVLAAVDPIYVDALRDPYSQFATVTVLQLLEHLDSTYAEIGPRELEENDKRMRAHYSATRPFETFVKQIQDAVDYAARGGEDISDARLLRIAYSVIAESGFCPDDCRTWMKQTTKTWATFQTHFRDAHKAWSLATGAAPPAPSFNAFAQSETQPSRSPAPSVRFATPASDATAPTATSTLTPTHGELSQDTVEAIANLAVATRADRDALASLTATVAALQADNRAKDAAIASLRAELRDARRNSRRSAPRNAANASPAANDNRRTADSGNRVHYCWTHGFKCDHPGFRCPDPAPGHCKRATKYDTMGGSTRTFQ